MGKRDPRETLGVRADASEDDLREAYRRLAMRYHPDRNGGDKAAEAKFKEVNEAYGILKKAGRRAAYDRLDHPAFERGAASGDGGSPGGFRFVYKGEFGSFGDADGGHGAGPRIRAGFAPEEALDGAKRTARTPSSVAREAAVETGAEPGRPPPAQTCPAREGAGRVQPERTPSVGAPTGAEDRTHIRLAGASEAGLHGAAADCPDMGASIGTPRQFQRDGGDIFVHVPLRATEAELEVTWPTKEAGLDVPLEILVADGAGARARTREGGRSRLRGKHLSALLILLIGGPLLYVRMPPTGPGLAAHAPGPITASVLPAPVLPEAAEEAPIGEAAAPAAAPAFGTTPGPELSAAAPAADAPAGLSAGPGPPSAVAEAGPSAVPSSPAPAFPGPPPSPAPGETAASVAAGTEPRAVGPDEPPPLDPGTPAPPRVSDQDPARSGAAEGSSAAPGEPPPVEADPRTAGTRDDQAADDARPQPGTSAEGDAAAGRAAADTPARGTDEAAKREDPGPTPSPAVGVAAPRPTTPEAGRGAPVQAGAAEGRVQAAPGSSALTQALVARGDAMVARRDISAARLLYERAATAGDRRAAAALARTYDPAFLAEVGTHGIVADPSLALAWYRKAASLGDDGARARMEALTRPDQATQGGP